MNMNNATTNYMELDAAHELRSAAAREAKLRSFTQVPFVDREYPVWNVDEAAHMRHVNAMKQRLDEADTVTEAEHSPDEDGEDEADDEGFTDEQLIALGLRDAGVQ